jgi:hypothetical protein
MNNRSCLRVAPQRFDTVIGFAFADGRISRVFAVRNPDKLRRLSAVTPLSR